VRPSEAPFALTFSGETAKIGISTYLMKKLITITLAGVACLYVYVFGGVNNEVTNDDLEAINIIFSDVECNETSSFEGQVKCASSMQDSLKRHIPRMECGDKGTNTEPRDFLDRGYGCCFDRARLLEKGLKSFGLETRHVALYDSSRFGLAALIVPGVSSHATLEVLTSNGWMGVDSNNDFILLKNDGTPIGYAQIYENMDQLQELPDPLSFYDKHLITVYGLYSRHGFRHGFNMPSPEVNWEQFFEHNF
jgi:transglutaminase superfamily protein